jgi:hypothetical protein
MGISKPNFQKRCCQEGCDRITGQLSNASNKGLQRYGKEPDIGEIVEVENRKTNV